MAIDRSRIRVKAMVVLPSVDGTRHVVSSLPPSLENPRGYDRLIGGSVELGETAVMAAAREVREELLIEVTGLRLLDVVENIFRIDGALGHEVVFVYSGRVPDGAVPAAGETFHEADGSELPVYWRPFEDSAVDRPLFPALPRGLLASLTDTTH